MATSASNLLDATIPPSIADEIGEGCPQSLLPSTMEKRKHAETGDGSPQSPPPPPSTEKRNRIENVEMPPQSLPPTETEEQKPCKCIGEGQRRTFDMLPADAQERYLKVKKKLGPLWDKLGMGNHWASDDEVGDVGFLFPDPVPNQNSLGRGANGGTTPSHGLDERT